MSKWYVVLTKPKQEDRAEEHLSAQGGEVFLPRIQLERMHKGKRVEVVEPLFPGYLFVNLKGCEQLVGSIRSARGVRQLLRFRAESLEVPQAHLKITRQSLNNLIASEEQSYY